MDRNPVGIAGIDVGTQVRTDEETLLEEDPGILRIRIWCRTFSVEMMEMQVFHFMSFCPADKGVDKGHRSACDTAQMDPVS